MQEALSGRAHTTMLATISPSSDNYIETMNTLKYAERLRRASVLLNASRDAAGPSNTKVIHLFLKPSGICYRSLAVVSRSLMAGVVMVLASAHSRGGHSEMWLPMPTECRCLPFLARAQHLTLTHTHPPHARPPRMLATDVGLVHSAVRWYEERNGDLG